MNIPVVPLFAKIVNAFIWFIYLFLASGVVYTFRTNFKKRPQGLLLRDDAWGEGDLKQSMLDMRKAVEQNYRNGMRSFWRYAVPRFLGLGILAAIVQRYLVVMTSFAGRIVLGSLVVVIFASLLFYIKVRFALMYGILEGLFAVVSCVVSLWNMGSSLNSLVLVGLFTSIYLMIRAMDNIKKGIDQNKAEERSVLSTMKRLSGHKAATEYMVWFAATVRATGELFFPQMSLDKNGTMVPPAPPIVRDDKYVGALFRGIEAEDLWKIKDPKTEDATFYGHELKFLQGSFAELLGSSKRTRIIPGAKIWDPNKPETKTSIIVVSEP
jgi:hypothetical protein